MLFETKLTPEEARQLAAIAHACDLPWGMCTSVNKLTGEQCTKSRWHSGRCASGHVSWRADDAPLPPTIEKWRKDWDDEVLRTGIQNAGKPGFYWCSASKSLEWQCHRDSFGGNITAWSSITIRVGKWTATIWQVLGTVDIAGGRGNKDDLLDLVQLVGAVKGAYADE